MIALKRSPLRANIVGFTLIVAALLTNPWSPPFTQPVHAAAEPHPLYLAPIVVDPETADFLPRTTLSTREYRPLPTPDPTPTPTSAPRPVTVAHRAIVGSHILAYPLPFKAKISTYFSSRHKAVDFYAQCGTPVLASFNGQILFAGWKTNGGGNAITLLADNGMTLSYDHLSGFSITTGALVTAGQQIGAVGATGKATGCHLHFGVMLKGKWVNPLLYL